MVAALAMIWGSMEGVLLAAQAQLMTFLSHFQRAPTTASPSCQVALLAGGFSLQNGCQTMLLVGMAALEVVDLEVVELEVAVLEVLEVLEVEPEHSSVEVSMEVLEVEVLEVLEVLGVLELEVLEILEVLEVEVLVVGLAVGMVEELFSVHLARDFWAPVM